MNDTSLVKCPLCEGSGLDTSQDSTCPMCDGIGAVTQVEHDEYDARFTAKAGTPEPYPEQYLSMSIDELHAELATMKAAYAALDTSNMTLDISCDITAYSHDISVLEAYIAEHTS